MKQRVALVLVLVSCHRSDPSIDASAIIVLTPTAIAPAASSITPAAASSNAPAASSNAPSVGLGSTGAVEHMRCTSDADCVITTLLGCCVCPAQPFAIHKAELKARETMCSVSECGSFPRDCPKVSAPSAYRAVCTAGTCATVTR